MPLPPTPRIRDDESGPDAEPPVAPSRRGLLHGVAAAGAVTAGLVGAVEVHNVAAAATGPRALDRHRRRHRRRRRHKHRPSTSPTPSPTSSPTIRPSDPPTNPPSATVIPTTPASSSASTAALIDDPVGRNLVSRFSFGLTPTLAAEVQQAGGPTSWFEQQLAPDTVDDDAADATASWWPSLTRTPLELFQRDRAGAEYGWQVGQNYQAWLLTRRTLTRRSVHELMTEFWENHLNVPVQGDGCYTWRADYGRTIRAHALGRYDDLLTAAVTHPAMLIYLNGAISTKAHPNENLGRELLELHTVGAGNYTETDVQDSARILTGWRVDVWNTWAAFYSTDDHSTGPVSVLDFSDANAAPDGRALTRAYLGYLAHHPDTARRIATKIAVRFCRDDPSPALVDLLTQVYLSSGTDITAVLSALVGSAEFQSAGGSKIRTPCDDVVATLRVLDVAIGAPASPVPGDHVSMASLYQCMTLGQDPLNWPRPDGSPIDSDSWLSPARMVGSMGAHWLMANGYYPTTGATYRTPTSWLPDSPTRLDDLVDYVAQQVLLSHATPEMVTAVCLASRCAPDEVITADHWMVRWNFGRLLATLLDSPTHLTR